MTNMIDLMDAGGSHAGSRVITGPDGSLFAGRGYGEAVHRLYEYEQSGVLPEDVRTGNIRANREKYTIRASNGSIYARRGWECVLNRLRDYESFGLTPEQWSVRYASDWSKE